MAVEVIFEVLAILLIAYGYIHEDELIELEDVLSQYIRKKLKKGR